jgi:hypothetical protein
MKVVKTALAPRGSLLSLTFSAYRYRSFSTAAREIAAAVRGYRGKHASLRQHIVSRLEQELGHLEDVPGESAIRQMPEFQ